MIYDLMYLFFFFVNLVLILFTRSMRLCFMFFLTNVWLLSFTQKHFFTLNSFFAFYISFLWVCIVLYIGVANKLSKTPNGLMLPLFFIYCGGLLLLSNLSLLSVIIGFELMLLSSLILLKTTSKSDRALEAVVEMFTWGIIGSFFLFLGLVIFGMSEHNIITLDTLSLIFFLLGFGIKIPVWPFTSWLLKAHVEASTEFSIFLSGFLVKFGILGLYNIYSYHNINFFFFYVLNFLAIVGIIDATIRLFAQLDLKRIVALTTVIETNWLVLCLSYNTSALNNVATWLIIIHCFTTTLEFYFVEAVYRRYGSRNFLNIFSLAYNYPNLYKIFLFNTFTTIGLPGTSIFIAKFVFFSSLILCYPMICVLFGIIFLIVIPVFFIKLFLVISGGSVTLTHNNFLDLSTKEIFIFGVSIVFTVFFGFYPTIIA